MLDDRVPGGRPLAAVRGRPIIRTYASATGWGDDSERLICELVHTPSNIGVRRRRSPIGPQMQASSTARGTAVSTSVGG
jgi:hypothetical protein